MRGDWLIVALVLVVTGWYAGWTMGQNAQPVVSVVKQEDMAPEVKRLAAMIEAERQRDRTEVVVRHQPDVVIYSSYGVSATASAYYGGGGYFSSGLSSIGHAVTSGW